MSSVLSCLSSVAQFRNDVVLPICSNLELKQPGAAPGILLSICVIVKAAAKASVEKKAANKKKKIFVLKKPVLKT